MITDAEKRYIAKKKLPSLATRPEAGKKYRPCFCGSSYWLEERKAQKLARWQSRDNKEFNNQYVRHGKIDPIVKYQVKRKVRIPIRFSQLSDKEKQEFIAQMKRKQEEAIKQHAKEVEKAA